MDGPTIATLAVAAGTVTLAWATFRLGSRAGEEIRAQWRPVLLINIKEQQQVFGGGLSIRLNPISREENLISMAVTNAGRGPALDVCAIPNRGRAHRPTAIIGCGDEVVLAVDLDGTGELNSVVVELVYSDISGAGYSTTLLISLEEKPPALISQVFEIHPPLHLSWMKVVPRKMRPWLGKFVLRRRGWRVP